MVLGIENWEDAGAVTLTDDQIIVQNIDAIAPVTDNAFDYGRIAAANALSDIYAKGGTPVSAMNLLCLPSGLDRKAAHDILRGVIASVSEAGAAFLGGHTVEADELLIGLAVIGIAKPQDIIKNSTCQPGDSLVLTKPLGTGIVATANKRGRLPSPPLLAKAVQVMAQLNKPAAAAAKAVGIHACTDVTGFGLLGHLAGMVRASQVGARLFYDALPLLPEVESLAAQGIYSPAVERNQCYFEDELGAVSFSAALAGQPHKAALLYDPQTSGGLLFSVDPRLAQPLVARLHVQGQTDSAIIGEIVRDNPGQIIIM